MAKHYIEILSIGKDSLDAKKLINFKAPKHAMKVCTVCVQFSLVNYDLIEISRS